MGCDDDITDAQREWLTGSREEKLVPFDGSEPWLQEPAVSTLRWVKTIEGNEVPIRYTEMLVAIDKLHVIIEIWPKHPATVGKLTFRHELAP